jgi:hypothetical protein
VGGQILLKPNKKKGGTIMLQMSPDGSKREKNDDFITAVLKKARARGTVSRLTRKK